MKILRIVSSGYEQGGVENGIVLTNKILRSHGHEVKTISSDLRPDMPHYSDYEFAHIPAQGISKIINGTFNFSAYRATKKVLRDFQPDVVLLHTLSQSTESILFLLKKYPTIYFIHGPEIFTKALLPWCLPKDAYKHGGFDLGDLTFYGKLRYYYFRYILGYLYKRGMRNVDQIVALSNYTLKFLRQEGFKAKYIPNGARLLKPAVMQSGRPNILYVGRLEKFKGVDDLVSAMPLILKKIPAVKLTVIGEGSYQKELKKICKILDLEKYIEFLGHVDNKKLDANYKKCSIFVLPSTWPETFGKVGIEAMSVGRPVVATDVGGVRDWLRDGKNGYLVPPNNPEMLADKIINILSNKNIAFKFSKQAEKTAQEFSIESMAFNIEKLIKKYDK